MSSARPPVLIADHDPPARAALAKALEGAGCHFDTTAAGKEALGRLSRERFDLLIADARLPDIGGIDLLKALRRREQMLPVIVTSTGGSVPEAVAAIQAGACDYLLKPVPREVLAASVRKALLGPAGAQAARGGLRESDARADRKTLITQDPRLLELLATARRVARSTATVLITGESGTGKELLAAYMHRHGLAPEAPYVAVNCAALPDTLAESELFGHEKGAFTGAVSRKMGKFELARKGSIVLDEIGEMSLPLQAKLLRVLQEREIDRVGGEGPIPVEARVIAVTNRELSDAVAEGRFREDLFYRINVVSLKIPPLRERLGDIPLLAHHFLEKFNSLAGRSVARFSAEALELLSRNCWKGNVRELENAVERAVLLTEGDTIQPHHLQLSPGAGSARTAVGGGPFRVGTTVSEMERQLIMGTLNEVRNNRVRAAELLGISIRTLRNKLKEYREQGELRSGDGRVAGHGTEIAASSASGASAS
ncbi:MAG: sigma-54 dependent transcriptional regulator [Desulfobacterales bacterium]|nr:sigma-54 dependent transcriptional regulator [Desulfobacterales bacterium]